MRGHCFTVCYVQYVLLSIVIQPSWLPNPIKVIIITRLVTVVLSAPFTNPLTYLLTYLLITLAVAEGGSGNAGELWPVQTTNRTIENLPT